MSHCEILLDKGLEYINLLPSYSEKEMLSLVLQLRVFRRPKLKQWVKKLVDQLDMDWSSPGTDAKKTAADTPTLSEDRATLLYILDVFNKNLFEVQNHSVRKVRNKLDTFAKDLMKAEGEELENVLFRFRQFISSYRIDEVTYVQNTFDDFKRIIWDFADNLSEEVQAQASAEGEINNSLQGLREAVESNSIEDLRSKSRESLK
jgi:hypothetical protein